MTTFEPAFTVEEVSMQEWAMAAFHAARAPQRVRVTVKTVSPQADQEDAVRAPGYLWITVAALAAALAWWLI